MSHASRPLGNLMPASHRSCTDGSAREPDLLELWSERPTDAEPDRLSGKSRPAQPCGRASLKSSASSVCAAHAEFVASLAASRPRPIPIDADALDLEDRADHLNEVLGALSVYLAVILDDTAQNIPGSVDLRDAEGLIADLASDVTGAIQRAADDMAWRVA